MDVENLQERIRNALQTHSLRTLAQTCEVSHELIRTLAASQKSKNLTLSSFQKINEGLAKNGF